MAYAVFSKTVVSKFTIVNFQYTSCQNGLISKVTFVFFEKNHTKKLHFWTKVDIGHRYRTRATNIQSRLVAALE